MTHPVLIDTDIGVDDALALILALRSPELDVKAITTVAGNAHVRHCTRNVVKILDLLHVKHDVEVAQGSEKPLRRKLVTAPEVHGRDGMGNTKLRLIEKPRKIRRNAANLILDLCDRYPRRLVIVALGPLTNLARAWRTRPQSLRKARAVISMGGAFRVPGNTGPVAEFNYFVDPEAADEMMISGLPIWIVPLDCTEQVVLMRAEMEYRAHRRPNPVSRFLLRATRSYMLYHRKTEGFHGGFLHDPLAVGAAINPGWFRWVRSEVRVEASGKWTSGMSVADFRKRPGVGRPYAHVAMKIDKERFLRTFHERLWA